MLIPDSVVVTIKSLEIVSSRTCILCSLNACSDDDSQWVLVSNRAPQLASLCQQVLGLGTVEFRQGSWLCQFCVRTHFCHGELDLARDHISSDPVRRAMAQAIRWVRIELQTEGHVMYSDVVSQYESIYDENVSDPKPKSCKLTTFKRYFDRQTTFDRFPSYSVARKLGLMFYNPLFFTSRGAAVLYDKLCRLRSVTSDSFSPSGLRDLIKKTVSSVSSIRNI